mmetsp:Transcript_24069/g.56554  ORF Transcript_24069/g.56554 Transcript_24069/m.56554 type:complete len:229 (+) Transcript_24069:513-1199(+)
MFVSPGFPVRKRCPALLFGCLSFSSQRLAIPVLKDMLVVVGKSSQRVANGNDSVVVVVVIVQFLPANMRVMSNDSESPRIDGVGIFFSRGQPRKVLRQFRHHVPRVGPWKGGRKGWRCGPEAKIWSAESAVASRGRVIVIAGRGRSKGKDAPEYSRGRINAAQPSTVRIRVVQSEKTDEEEFPRRETFPQPAFSLLLPANRRRRATAANGASVRRVALVNRHCHRRRR